MFKILNRAQHSHWRIMHKRIRYKHLYSVHSCNKEWTIINYSPIDYNDDFVEVADNEAVIRVRLVFS